MIKEYLKYIIIFLAPLILIFIGGYLGYSYGKTQIELSYKRKIAELNYNFSLEREKYETKSNYLSAQYMDAKNKLDNIYDDNMELVERLREQERTNQQLRANRDTRCVTKPATCPAISARVAKDVTKLLKQADSAAAYAVTCREWINTLQETQTVSK